MRKLTIIEQSKIKILTENQVLLTLIEPTETGLGKSIMDATGSVRTYLKDNNIHDYAVQLQGTAHKVLKDTLIYEDHSVSNSKASLYRPKTKKGDPRIWFSGLNRIARAHDIIAVTFYSNSFHVFNLTKLNVKGLLETSQINPFKDLIQDINNSAREIATELLFKLKEISREGPIPSVVPADTSVGRTLETALGIEINSSRQPDYKGIELKSFRSNRTNRKNLFAQVPDWPLSKFKSSAEILEAFGYWRDDVLKLYCTVSSTRRNSQGLILRLDAEIKQLIENSDENEYGDFAIWSLDTLHERLLEKHKETFWVEALSTFRDGREYFHYTLVEHTKKPIISQFDILIEQGIITLDHLIKRDERGRVREKGPIFKIKSDGLDLLFPPSERYSLI